MSVPIPPTAQPQPQPWTERTAKVIERQGPAEGMAAAITYTVRLFHDGGFTDYKNVTPSHRRPSTTTEIQAALTGDPCIVIFEHGYSPRFIIFEGLITEGC